MEAKKAIVPMPHERLSVRARLAASVIIFVALAVLLILKLTGILK